MTPVKYEGYCGASWAFSTAAFFEQDSIKAGIANETLDLSEAYLIACNPEYQGCMAGEIESSIDLVINNQGIPLENLYPFNPDTIVISTICLTTSFFSVPNVSRISYYRIYDPETIKKIIFKKPVIAAVCGIDLSFHFPSSNSTPGRTLKCKPQNRILDHSVLLIGYTETEWIVKNHWGTGWGINGYAYISRNPSEDCCIGEQLHTSGAITAQCSVQYCQTCVQNDTCYKCAQGRWVKHNTTTGVQTCDQCTQENCNECYNYKGTCKWCADGFGINITLNSTSGKCVTISIAFCNQIQGTHCTQCKPGYRLSSTRTACNPYCPVINCNKCVNGPCTECKNGFAMVNQVVNGKSTQFCHLNPCTVANCSLCNSTGQCVACASSFTLQANGACTTNCTAIANCVSCSAGSTACTECIVGRSWNSSKRTCQTFAGTANCRVHRTTCTSCRGGYTLSSGQCIQTCDSVNCSVCVKTDISICLVCYSGYYLQNTTINGTTYATVCIPNPCNITNCSLCGPDGVGCVKCATKYLVYNSTSNICQNLCNLTNCRDCLTTGTTAGQCDYCNPGYSIDYDTKLCVTCQVENCLTSYVYDSEQFCWTCINDYYTDDDELACLIYCTDYYCEFCDINSLYACTKCFDGYFMYLTEGSLECSYIFPTLKGCNFVSFNQTYCHYCTKYYEKNNQTGLCQLNTNNCPSYCQYCTTNQSYAFQCKCSSGIFQWFSEKCIASPFNDTDCYIVQLYGSSYFCMKCLNGKVVNLNQTGCESPCIIPSCTICQQGYNNYCWTCDEGFFLTTISTCQQCPFENCKSCKSTMNCLECKAGYELAPNQRECLKIVCPQGFLFTGYECTCPIGTYFTPLRCEPCLQFKCKSCSTTKCYSCENQYYLTPDFKCDSCLPKCKVCTSRHSCDHCLDGFLYEANTSQCISPSAQGGAFFTNGSIAIQCPFGCLQCDNIGKCTECAPGFSVSGGLCLNCQGSCKTCQPTNPTFCTSCQDGYYLNQTSCVKCNDTNCEKCMISTTFCEKCKEGFYMYNNTCKACMGSNCLSCNLYGECTRCSSGYGLTANHSCQQCAGNCVFCTGISLNQCLLVCNSSQYEVNGTCQNCPSKCLSCVSTSMCSSCVPGYHLRNGACKPTCAEGCYLCDQTNPDVCLQCFTGYMLSEVGTCSADITCNTDKSCFVCPSNWTVINKMCEICNTEGDCIQCAVGNVGQCGLCKDGFFLNSTVCTLCESSCLKCSSLERCQLCKEGFFIPQAEVYGSCRPCNSICKTCVDLATKCASCKEGYELSVAGNCLRMEKIKGEIELDIAISSFVTVSDNVRADIVKMAGESTENGARYYVITDLREGSVILGFQLAIPEGKDADKTYTEFESQLSNMTEIGGVPLIAIKKMELFKPAKNNSNNPVPPEPETPMIVEPATINTLAIILGVVIPSVIIILAVIAYTFRRKIFRNRNPEVENILEEEVKKNSSEVVIHVRNKLPPIVAVHQSSFTHLKEEENMDMTGQNKNYFNSTGLPQEHSYSKLEGLNDESRNDFDQTLNNIVAELNEGYKNKLNAIDEGDQLNNFNEDLSEIKGSQRGMMDNEPILQKMDNELMDDIEFNADTLRQMNELQEQSPEGKKVQVKGGDKGHLQIIEFEKQPLEDL